MRAKAFLQRQYIRWRLKHIPGLHLGDRVRIIGAPIIDSTLGGEIWIEDQVTLNSSNTKYHINMHSPVKLFTDKPGAIIRIGELSRIHGSCIHASREVRIGKKCLVAANCHIMDVNGHELSFENVENRIHTHDEAKPVVIEDCVWIGANTIIFPGITIGRGSVVAAGSVVCRDIPPMVLAGGNPVKVLREYRP